MPVYMSIYFPFHDFREMCLTGRRLYPPWPVIDVDKKSLFQKNLGAIRRRPRGGLRGWIQEREICEIGRSIRIRADKGIRFRKRFYYDGTFSGYFSVGISGNLRDKPGKVSLTSLTKIIQNVLSLEVSSRHAAEQDIMGGYGRLALSVFGNGSSVPAMHCSSQWFGADPPLVIFEIPLLWLDQDILAAARTRKFFSGSVVYIIDASSAAREPPFIIIVQLSRSNDQDARQARMVLARLYCEFCMLGSAVNLLASPQADEMNQKLSDYFCSRLSDGLARVSGSKRISMLRDPEFYSEFTQIFLSAFDQSKIDAFAHGLEVHGARRNLREAFLRSQLLVQAANENQLEVIMGSKYVNHGVVGNMGDNASGPNSINAQNTMVGMDAAKVEELLAELEQVKRALIEDGSTDALIAAAAVSQAGEKAKEGDETGMITALKDAGSWALGVATSISVPLAIAVIKKATGL